MKFSQKLKKMKACKEAVDWVGDRTEAEAWRDCERIDWMLWYAAQKYSHPKVVGALCAALRAVDILQYILAGEDRPRIALETAEAWAKTPTESNGLAVAGAAVGTAGAVRDAWAAWDAWAASATMVTAWAAAHKTMCCAIRRSLRKEKS